MGTEGRSECEKAGWNCIHADDLREIQDWIVRPQLQRVRELQRSTIGGFEKTYVVSVKPDAQLNISLEQLQQALSKIMRTEVQVILR